MSWAQLMVVGVEGLAEGLGCDVRSVMVRDQMRRLTVLRSADEPSPVLDQLVTTQEFKGLIEARLWFAAEPAWPAERYKVAFVLSSSFRDALSRAAGQELSGGRRLSDTMEVVYGSRTVVRDFRLQAAKSLLHQVKICLCSGDAASAEALLDQARYVCDRNTENRIELHALYRRAVSQETWAAIAEDAQAETGLGDEALEQVAARLLKHRPVPGVPLFPNPRTEIYI